MALFSKPKREPAPPAPAAPVPQATVLLNAACPPVLDTAFSSEIGTRDYQQDAAYVSGPLYSPGSAIAVLCDGMGGMQQGERASGQVVAFFANALETLPPQQELPTTLKRLAQECNLAVLRENARLHQEAGTTLVAAVVMHSTLYWLSIGDSRLYILRQGELVQVSKDHNFALELSERVAAGQLSAQAAESDPRREALISYIGAPTLERIDLGHGFSLFPGDLVLLCSDGLTKALSPQEICSLLLQEGSLAQTAKRLTGAAVTQSPESLDNTTVILLRYHGAAQLQ